jgi:mono/diheme cytochrome c family protein
MGCEYLGQVLGEPGAVDFSEPPAPPPISGGTLLVTRDKTLAVAADADADRVFVIDLDNQSISRTIQLNAGDEPGRVIEGPEGKVLVALRSGGAFATVDLASGNVERRSACPAPRGIAYDAEKGEIHVACAGGELVTFPEEPGAAASRALRLDRDLRDIVVKDGNLLVSRFRSAELLVVSGTGEVASRAAPLGYISPKERLFSAAVGWRMVEVEGGVAMVHQRAFSEKIPTGPSSTGATYYGGPCDMSIVHSAVTVFDSAGAQVTLHAMGGIGNVTLPVDIAASPDGRIAVAGAGANMVIETTLGTVKDEDAFGDCSTFGFPKRSFNVSNPIAVAYGNDGRLLVQGRDTLLHFIDLDGTTVATVPYPEVPRLHTGHLMFHAAAGGTGSPIACASCHPEGHVDGRVWQFENIGPRRTQSMLGGVMNSAPFHWDGDMETMDDLMGEVFVNRMGGVTPSEAQIVAMADFIHSLPALPVSEPLDAAAVIRGQALFNEPKVGCATCHAGPTLTNNQTLDVGTGKAFQVPSLVGIGDRAPFMHDGCAPTLRDRFNPACGGGDAHGYTSHLSETEIGDLIAYLETL